MMRLSLAAGLAVLAWHGTAAAESAVDVPVRVGEHAGFGRLVLDFPETPVWRLERQGDQLILHLPPTDRVNFSGTPPRNVRAIEGGLGEARIALAPGAAIRVTRLGTRLAVDVTDPPDAKHPATIAIPAAATTAALPAPQAQRRAAAHSRSAHRGRAIKFKSEPAQVPQAPLLAATAPPSPLSVAPAPPPLLTRTDATPADLLGDLAKPRDTQASESPAGSPVGPAADGREAAREPQSFAALPAAQAMAPPGGEAPLNLAAKRITPPAEWGGAGILLPFGPVTGAAAFRRGNEALVVFDEVRPIDLAALQGDAFFGHAVVRELPTGTLLRLPLAPEAALALQHTGAGWVVVETVRPPALAPINPVTRDAATGDGVTVVLPAQAAAKIVPLTDPETGSTLLVGTQHVFGQGVAVARHAPEFTLLPSWMGVAVEALSDRPVLQADMKGFILGVDGGRPGLAVSPILPGATAMANADALTRRFDFPDLPRAALFQRLQAATDAAASVPERQRAAPRRDVAATMIALGLGVEAQAVMNLTIAEDPRAAEEPTTIGLAAIAALVADRPAEAAGIDDPRLAGSDEVTLWRAVRRAMLGEGDPTAAASLATVAPLILSYPTALRRKLLPLAAETMVLGGQTTAAAALLAHAGDDDGVALARGMLAEKQGDAKAALAIYDQLTGARDRRVHARAAVLAVELRRATGVLSAAQAAAAEDKLLYAWRGDEHEVAARLHLADLRQQAGEWRQALALLRESETIFPADKPRIHTHLAGIFAALLRDDAGATLSPLDLVTLVEENTDLLPEGPAGEALIAHFADQLSALDLPGQAEPVFNKLMLNAPTPTARAEFGARLAALRLDEHDFTGVQAALDASAGEGLSSALIAARARLAARAAAGTGDLARAMALLADQHDAAADETRAALLEAAHDWPAAEKALAAYVDETLPSDGPLTEGQSRLVLRLAGAAAEAGDEATLGDLARGFMPRFPAGPLAEMFRVLTEKPVRGVADLPQISKEIAAAHALPVALQAIGGGASRAN